MAFSHEFLLVLADKLILIIYRMIANLTLSLLLTLTTALAFGQSVSTKEFHYYYQLAHDFDINPPELEFGYPWWYDADSLPVTGIIFLKEDLDISLEKLNDTAWVAEPTETNAKEIWAFSEIKGFPKFCIVPDSSLTHKKVFNFLDELVSDIGVANFLFYSKDGAYSIMNYYHPPPSDFWFCGDGGFRGRLEVRVNNDFDFLIENDFSSIDSIERIVFDAYFLNFDEDVNDNEWIYKRFTQEDLLHKIGQFEELQADYEEDYPIVKSELTKFKVYLKWFEKYSFLHEIDPSAFLRLEFVGNLISIQQAYLVFNEINKGLYKARDEICLRQSYFELFVNRQFDKLNFIHAQIPDLITDYKREIEILELPLLPVINPEPIIPGPPPIPEDSKEYRKYLDNPGLEHPGLNELIDLEDTLR